MGVARSPSNKKLKIDFSTESKLDSQCRSNKQKKSQKSSYKAEGLTVNALKYKYESEFKKRLATSNAQVKTKKCGGFTEIIQPVKTANNIPFLFNDQKVKTLNRYLDSSEPQVPIPQSYISNTIGQP